jgi:Ran GTPase-activating protein (RanGAP) involved in mRNA processing and transport
MADEKVEKYELAELNLNLKQQQESLETPSSKLIRKKGEEHMFLLSNLKAQHPLAEHVQQAKVIRHLELSNQPIQAAQLDTLQRRLPYLKSIISINLSFTKLSDQLGGPALLTQLLGKKSRIKTLHLNDNNLGLYSFKAICDLLPLNTTLTVLNLHNNNGFSQHPKIGQQLGQALKSNKTLKHLSVTLYDAIMVNNKRGVTYTGNPSLMFNTGFGHGNSPIESLQLSGATITPRSMEVFRKLKAPIFKSLTSLNLSHCYIGPVGTFYLADAISKVKFTTLINLNLSNNRIGCDGAISVGSLLKHNYTITSINVQSNQIQNKGVIGLCKSLEQISKRKISSPIRSIDLSFNPIEVSSKTANPKMGCLYIQIITNYCIVY